MTARKDQISAKALKLPDGCIPYSRFALRGHAWVDKSLLENGQIAPDQLIREDEGQILFRLRVSEIGEFSFPPCANTTTSQGLQVREENIDAMDIDELQETISHALSRLYKMTRANDAAAASCLVRVAQEATVLLEKLGVDQAGLQIIRPVAARYVRWPIRASVHFDARIDLGSLFKDLMIGTGTPFDMDPGAKWRFDPAGDVAYQLLVYMWGAHKSQRSASVDYRILGNCRLDKRIDALPDLYHDSDRENSATEWRDLAIDILKFSYGEEIQEIPELLSITRGGHKKPPSRAFQNIKDQILARFKAFARPSKDYQ